MIGLNRPAKVKQIDWNQTVGKVAVFLVDAFVDGESIFALKNGVGLVSPVPIEGVHLAPMSTLVMLFEAKQPDAEFELLGKVDMQVFFASDEVNQ